MNISHYIPKGFEQLGKTLIYIPSAYQCICNPTKEYMHNMMIPTETDLDSDRLIDYG